MIRSFPTANYFSQDTIGSGFNTGAKKRGEAERPSRKLLRKEKGNRDVGDCLSFWNGEGEGVTRSVSSTESPQSKRATRGGGKEVVRGEEVDSPRELELVHARYNLASRGAGREDFMVEDYGHQRGGAGEKREVLRTVVKSRLGGEDRSTALVVS